MAAVRELKLAEKILLQKVQELQKKCLEIQRATADVEEVELLERAEGKCKKCLELLEKGQGATRKEILYKALQQYSQALLDETYVLECRLVNEDFPEDRSADEIKTLIERLGLPEELAKQMFGAETEARQVLGADLMECLYWRRGALCYMYCHTVFNNAQRWKDSTVHFMKCTELGVDHLQSMLSVRSPLAKDSNHSVQPQDSDVVNLLRQGVFSDTHLLALVYSGELCYWHWQASKTSEDLKSQQTNESAVRNFNSVSTGIQCLQKFVDVVKGSFQVGKGWDCSRAEQMLADLLEAQCSTRA